jgi:hypothetical protein
VTAHGERKAELFTAVPVDDHIEEPIRPPVEPPSHLG